MIFSVFGPSSGRLVNLFDRKSAKFNLLYANVFFCTKCNERKIRDRQSSNPYLFYSRNTVNIDGDVLVTN